MNSIKRIQAAISHQKWEHVPVDLYSFQPAPAALGIPPRKIFRKGEMLAEAVLKPMTLLDNIDTDLLYIGTSGVEDACRAAIEVWHRSAGSSQCQIA